MSGEIDRLVWAVVHSDDADRVNQALVEHDHRTTRINAQGGFLRRGNAVFLVGAPAAAVDEISALIRGNCTQPAGEGPGGSAYGVLFVVRASAFARL